MVMVMARLVGRIIIVFTADAATTAAVNSDGDADGSIGRSIIVSTAATATDNGDGQIDRTIIVSLKRYKYVDGAARYVLP